MTFLETAFYAIILKSVLHMVSQRSTEPTEEDRFTSLEETGEGFKDIGDDSGGASRSWYSDRILLAVVGVVLALDQLTKYMVQYWLTTYITEENIRLAKSWPQDGFFRLTYGTNSGMAFGLFQNQTLILIILSVVAIGFIYYFYRIHVLPSRLLRVAMGLLLGGALGNLFDRVRAGEVVDFIAVGWWPMFNLADSAIVIGIALLIGIVFFARDVPSRDDGAGGPVS